MSHFEQSMHLKDSDMIRVFFALWPDALIQQSLFKLAKQNRPKCNARLMRANSLHMTLQFIGEIERSRLPQLIKAASRVSASRFEITLDRLSFWKHNRIAYAAPNTETPELSLLVKALKQELASEGITSANDKFSAHVTLMRNVEQVMEPCNITPVTWPVDHFVLVESMINNQGARYQILHSWPLNH